MIRIQESLTEKLADKPPLVDIMPLKPPWPVRQSPYVPSR